MENTISFQPLAQPGLVLLATEPTKDVHDGAFAGFFKSSKRDVLGLGEEGFGFSHFLLHAFSSASLRGPACNRTQLFLNKVVST